MPPGTRSARRARCSPTRRFNASDSRTQGPAMRNSALLGKRAIAASVCGFDERPLFRLTVATTRRLGSSGDKSREERMRTSGPRLKLRMELTANEPRVRLELDDLDELAVRRESAQSHP